MSEYRPDNWVVIKFKGDDPHYRVLAGWSGGYTTGDSWKLNSGITSVERVDENFGERVYYRFYGSSGSVYHCNVNSYMLRMNNAYIWNQLKELHGDKIEMMPEETDWMKMDWIIK
jgi:hypothetical protein